MMIRILFAFNLLLCFFGIALAQSDGLTTKLTVADLDPAAYTQWVNGQDTPMPGNPTDVMWTTTTIPVWCGSTYGDSKQAGVRHIRIGFTAPRLVTTLLVRTGGQLSVLKPTVAYPGNLRDDNQWIPARRLRGRVSTVAEAGSEEYALWVLPPGTKTRALRFTHTAALTDTSYACQLGGIYMAEQRLMNIAPQAIVTASTRDDIASRINDTENNGTWAAWDNGEQGARLPVSAEHPATVMLRWPKAVTLSGLYSLNTGFSEVEVQAYTGSEKSDPRTAGDASWRTIRKYNKLQSLYPLLLSTQALPFPSPVTTRAIRLQITATCPESHPHLSGNTKQGKRVWLGELFALQALNKAPMEHALPPVVPASHPPIPIKFTLAAPGYVTLVIDSADGKRVRNLISETPFPAGTNTVWWDGMNDLGRDLDAARHGIYHVPGRLVVPGSYRVRGLYYRAIDLRYEFSLYNAGNPAWTTADNTGGWLTNHTPPSSALFVPASRAPGGKPLVYLGSYVSEGGHGLAWVDLDGRKQGGMGWVGGNWTGAPYLAIDTGASADVDTTVYVGSALDGELRLTALAKSGERSVLKQSYAVKEEAAITGLAAHNGVLAAALPRLNRLLFVEASSGKEITKLDMPDPRGLSFDATGRLMVLSGKQLLRLNFPPSGEGVDYSRPATQVLIQTGLEDPQHVTCDSSGNFYVSDRGTSHQVKLFDASGSFVRAIGTPGVPKAGPYDELHMNNPNGLTIDSQNRLWVAETDFQPKRVSVWSLEGKLLNAFYGPSQYGGGGTLDPQDKQRFYYNGMAFQLDWQKGTDQLRQVIYRPQPGDLPLPDGYGTGGLPETPIYANGQRYFTNCYTSNPTNGSQLAFIWMESGGVAIPVAALGVASAWQPLQQSDILPRWPAGVNPKDAGQNQILFTWSDLNGDAKVQPEEVFIKKASVGGVTVGANLSVAISRINSDAMLYKVARFTPQGAPIYNLMTGQILARGTQNAPSSGGDQVLSMSNGWSVFTTAPAPYSAFSVSGVFKGVPRWSYPNMWPGLHASHESPAPDHPGELVGVTRLLGGAFTPKGSKVGPLWCVNSNTGCMYLFTADGLFVASLFRDGRLGQSWSMPVAQRGMLMNSLTLHDENFWPSITQTADGAVYMIDGGRTSIVRVEGLNTLTRLPETQISVSKPILAQAQAYGLKQELQRQHRYGQETLKVVLRKQPPVIDGKLDDWIDSQWAVVDKRGVAAYFDSNSRPYDVRSAVSIAGDRLYAAFVTNDSNLLRNTGSVPNAPFKTGGALDIMIGTDPKAAASRTDPVAGDIRLLVTMVKGKPLALLYRAVVPGTKAPVPFSSPWRTITIDRVDDVSSQLQFAGSVGNYELSIPTKTLGLIPEDRMTIKGDLGILRGDEIQTVQRVYWSNKATGITADVPSEAQLTPQLWGRWVLTAGK